MKKILRITTIPISLLVLLKGQLSFINQYYKVIGVSNPEPTLEQVRTQENIEVKGIKMTRSITPIRDLISVVQMFKLMRKEQPFIVHSHTPKAGMVSMFASKLANIGIRIHTVAGLPLLEAKGIKRIVLNCVEYLTYTCATNILVNSHGLKEVILQNKLAPASKIKVIAYGSSNGIDTDYFNINRIDETVKEALRLKYSISESDIVFVFIGRLVKDKGVEELVDAFQQLSKVHRHVKLLMLGKRESELDPVSLRTDAEIKSNDRIIETGFVEDVRPFLSIADILVHPSYREGFPNVVMQAGAMDKPCIVSDINGCNEIIEHKVNGLIVPVKNVKQLHKAMNTLATDNVMRNKLGLNARQRIEQNYEQQFIWNELLKYYRSFEI